MDTSTPGEPYTVFRKRELRILTIVLALASLASPFTATIYLPLLPLLETRYHSSAQAINLTLTFYTVVQAVTPALFAPLSDSAGRRLVSLGTYLIYAVASLGLALNKENYAGLLLLRGLQALGASACVSIAYGVIADVCVQSERGGMVGPVMSATNVGTFLGPVLGGLIAWKSGGHEWVFWAMFIFGCTNFALLAACLPETSRTVVGNGRHRPASKSLWHLLVYGPVWQRAVANDNAEIDRGEREPNELEKTDTGAVPSVQPQTQPRRRRLTLANPLLCLRIMFAKDTALILLCGGVNYAVWYAISAMIPSVYKVRYGWNELEVGLAYLPGAAGVIIAGIANGKWMDYKYKRTARDEGFTVDKVKGDNLQEFHIERARCRELFYIWAPYNVSLIGLGWAIETQAHAAVSLVLQAMIGALGTFLFFCFNTLLVDVHPEQPSTAAAAATVFRCGLAAIGVAILQPLLVAVGHGWYLTMVAILVGGVQGIGLWAIQKWGWEWRRLRVNKMNRT